MNKATRIMIEQDDAAMRVVIAAVMNGTMTDYRWLQGDNLHRILDASVADYYDLAMGFEQLGKHPLLERDRILRLIGQTPRDNLLGILHEMGKPVREKGDAGPIHGDDPDGSKWDAFMDKYMGMLAE
jgi:hypothetical protein